MKENNISKKILVTLFLFILAGLFEIGGGYLMWLWLRENMGWVVGIIGGFILFLYGIVPTFQPTPLMVEYSFYYLLYGEDWWTKRDQIGMKLLGQ